MAVQKTKNKSQIILSEFVTAARIDSFVSFPVMTMKLWGYYLFSDEFKYEGLRRNLFLIWFVSLMDVVDGYKREKETLFENAKHYNNSALLSGCDKMREFFDITADFFNLYSKSDQIFIVYIRNTRVHSWLKSFNEGNPSIKWVENGLLKSENIPFEDLEKMVLPYTKQNYVASVNELHQRSINTKLVHDLKLWAYSDKPEEFSKNLFQGLRRSGKEPVHSVWKG